MFGLCAAAVCCGAALEGLDGVGGQVADKQLGHRQLIANAIIPRNLQT